LQAIYYYGSDYKHYLILMAKTVFILGAGASFKAGVPLMSNFLDEAKKLLLSGNLTSEDETHFQRVFRGISALQGIHSKSKLDINNLESVFATFEMAQRLNKMPLFESEEIPLLIKSMKRLIVVTIEQHLIFPVKDSQINLPDPYFSFGKMIHELIQNPKIDHNVSILTFNYDLAADLMAQKFDLGPDYSLPNSTSYGSKKVLKLLKLHGSINWGVTKDHERVRPYNLKDFLGTKGFTSMSKTILNVGTEMKNFERVKYHEEPVIIPPTWNKSNIHPDMNAVWQQAALELEHAENLFVIGFSLPETDIFFRHLYALGTIGKIPFNRFWVFDPDESGIVEQRYSELLGPGAINRFKFYKKTFEQAVEMLNEEFVVNSGKHKFFTP
jgi:hypothetical protein